MAATELQADAACDNPARHRDRVILFVNLISKAATNSRIDGAGMEKLNYSLQFTEECEIRS